MASLGDARLQAASAGEVGSEGQDGGGREGSETGVAFEPSHWASWAVSPSSLSLLLRPGRGNGGRGVQVGFHDKGVRMMGGKRVFGARWRDMVVFRKNILMPPSRFSRDQTKSIWARVPKEMLERE